MLRRKTEKREDVRWVCVMCVLYVCVCSMLCVVCMYVCCVHVCVCVVCCVLCACMCVLCCVHVCVCVVYVCVCGVGEGWKSEFMLPEIYLSFAWPQQHRKMHL